MVWEEWMHECLKGVAIPFSYFSTPEKRVFLPYLFCSLPLAFWVYRKKSRARSFWSYLFPRKVWLGSSAKVDYGFFLLNGVVKVLLIGPFLSYGVVLAFWINQLLVAQWGRVDTGLSATDTVLYYTLFITLFGDLSSYLVHRLMHELPILWQFHKTHHSATTLNPITQYRIHPVELVLNNMRGAFVFGFCTGIFDYLSHERVSMLTFIGVNVFTFAFFTFGANLRHSHVAFRYWGPLERVLISPYQHQIHHSDAPEHQGKNLGAKFAVWDALFGTLLCSTEVEGVRFGLGRDGAERNSFLENLFLLPWRRSL